MGLNYTVLLLVLFGDAHVAAVRWWQGLDTQNDFTYMSPFLTGTAARLGSVELLGKLDLPMKYQGLSFSMWSLQQSS